MNKCLVTKLQAIIDDNNLPKFGESVIVFANTSANRQVSLAPVNGTSITIKVSNGSFTASSVSGQTERTITSLTTFVFTNDVLYFVIKDYYNTLIMSGSGIIVPLNIKYMELLRTLKALSFPVNPIDLPRSLRNLEAESSASREASTALPGNVADLPLLQRFIMYGGGVGLIGSWDDYFVNYPEVLFTNEFGAVNAKYSGDIVNFCRHFNVKDSTNSAPVLYIESSKFSGEITGVAQVYTDIINKSLKIYCKNTQMTYNGESASRHSYVKLIWDSNGSLSYEVG